MISPIDDTPAKKSGLKTGDVIVKIDNETVKGMSMTEAVKRLRGEPKSPVHLLVFRQGDNGKPKKYTLVRELIRLKTVKSKLYDKKLGYVRISHFQENTSEELKKAIDDLKKQSQQRLEGIVLDLRDNPGGLLDTAITTSDAFIDASSKSKPDLMFLPKVEFLKVK